MIPSMLKLRHCSHHRHRVPHAAAPIAAVLLLAAGIAFPYARGGGGDPVATDSVAPREAFPLPRHDPRPLLQALVERVQPTETTRFTFTAISDLHSRREEPMFALLQALKPDIALMIGDIINVGSGPRGLTEYRRLEAIAGPFFRTVPVWAVPGNHEVARGGRDEASAEQQAEARRRFSAYFGQPHDDLITFTYANATFIGLPFEFYDDDTGLERLDQKLAAAAGEGRHTFIFSHHSYFTGRWRPQNPVRDAAAALFARYGVTAVLGAHTHIYYRRQREGVHYILNATAGMSGQLPAERNHAALRNALPDDVWFSRQEEGGLIIRPEGQEPTPVEGSRHFATVITVEGPLVEFRLVNTDGREVDRAVLAGAPEPTAP